MSRSGDAKLCNGCTSSRDVHARLLRHSHGPFLAISRDHGQHAPGLGWFRLLHCCHDDCRQQQSTGVTAGLQREQQRLSHPLDRGCPEASEHRQGGRLATLRPHLRRRTAGSLQDSRLLLQSPEILASPEWMIAVIAILRMILRPRVVAQERGGASFRRPKSETSSASVGSG